MNRRRMSGHRVVSGGAPPGFSIRAPWAVYEANTGISATGNGPTLTGGAYQAAIVGQGVSPGAEAQVSSPPGFSLGPLTFSLGFWLELIEGSFASGFDFAAAITIDDAADRIEFLAASDDEELGMLIMRVGDGEGVHLAFQKFDFTEAPVGYYHFGLSVSSGVGQFYINGAAVGISFSVAPNTFFSSLVSVGNNFGSGVCGPMAQAVIAEVAYTAEEWAYIYNAGAGRAYSTWSIAP